MQVAQVVNNAVYYVMQDGLGSVRLVRSSGGSNTFSSDYAPFGQSHGATGTQTSRYIGQPYDSATGLYLFGARFYDPTIGRFITQDTYSGMLSDPLSLNRYIYAGDNPMTFSDPTGHFSWTTVALIGAVVGLTVVSALQLGLDPGTDALDVAAVAELSNAVTEISEAVTVSAVSAAAVDEGAPFIDASSTDVQTFAEGLAQRGISSIAVIGEDSTNRVIPFANQLADDLEGSGVGVEKFETTESSYFGRLAANSEWVQNAMQRGIAILDIGSAPDRVNYPLPSGAYYGPELNQVAGYANLFRMWIP